MAAEETSKRRPEHYSEMIIPNVVIFSRANRRAVDEYVPAPSQPRASLSRSLKKGACPCVRQMQEWVPARAARR
jgi:hypothetical protein